MPPQFSSYIEVFGGAGWVLFGMERIAPTEIYNDFNGNLVNLFRCVKERIVAFLLELGFLPLTARDDFKLLKRFLKRKQFTNPYLAEELELTKVLLAEPSAEEIRSLLKKQSRDIDLRRAVTFFKIIRYSYASKGTSFGCKAFDVYKTFSLLWEANRRLRNTLVENQHFAQLIPHYDHPDAFFYLDPPYFGTEIYYEEVNFKRKEHIQLRDALAKSQGKWLLSYNDSRHIRFLYRHYHIEAVERLDNMAQRYDGGKVYREILISNYDTMERRKTEPLQTCLFTRNIGGNINGNNHQPHKQRKTPYLSQVPAVLVQIVRGE